MESGFIQPNSGMWNDLLHSLDHDVYHIAAYARLSAHTEGGEALGFFTREHNRTFFVPLMLSRIANSSFGDTIHHDAVSAYGYPGPLAPASGDDADFWSRSLALFSQSLSSRGVVATFLRLHPVFNEDAPQVFDRGTLVQHGRTIAVDLSLSESELWSHIRSGHRNEINRATRTGQQALVDEKWAYWDQFLDIYTETMLRVNASSDYFFSPQYFEDLMNEFRDIIHLIVVVQEGEVIAAALFTEINGIVQYHLSGSRTAHLRVQPTKLLLHYAILWAKSRGDRVLHLGGGLNGREDSLFRFKHGFSKLTLPFRTWRLINDQAAYDQLVNEWEQHSGVKADAIDGFFPAYRKSLTSSSKSFE